MKTLRLHKEKPIEKMLQKPIFLGFFSNLNGIVFHCVLHDAVYVLYDFVAGNRDVMMMMWISVDCPMTNADNVMIELMAHHLHNYILRY